MTTLPPDKFSAQNSSSDFRYWAGRVDAKLEALQEMLSSSLAAQQTNWAELAAWKRKMDEQMMVHKGAIARLDEKVDNLSASMENAQKDDDEQKAVTWKWIIDKIFTPVIIWGILYALAYAMTHKIVP